MIDSMGPAAVRANNFAYTALTTAIFNGHDAAVDVIVSKTEIDLNTAGRTGNTALNWACYFGQYAIAKALLDQGADHSLRNVDGLTPLALASRKGFREIVVLLRKYGAQA